MDAIAQVVARVKRSIASKQITRPTIDAERAPDWFHEGQLKVWNSDKQTVVACAGTQGGKTASSPYWLLREIQRTAELARELGHGKYFYVVPNLTLAASQVVPKFRALFEDELRLGTYTASPKPKFEFSPEGARRLIGSETPLTVFFGYANDSSNLESATALGAVWDETGQKENKEESYEALMRRLTIARSHGHGRLLCTTTPYEWGWFKRRVVDLAHSNPNLGYFNWPSWSNPYVSEAACREELAKGMPDWRWRMMYQGEWTRPAGAVFDCFDAREGYNLIARKDLPEFAEAHIGIDFGPQNTAGAIAAFVDGVIYVYASYHGASDDATKHTERFKQKAKCKFKTAWGGNNTEKKWRSDYRNAGLDVMTPPITGANTYDVQLTVMYRAFREKKVVICSDLVELINEVQGCSYKVDGEGRITDMVDDQNSYHRLDALRYLIIGLLGQPQNKKLGARFDKAPLQPLSERMPVSTRYSS